jgi:DNA-binding transcriptional ArsR family regulator
MAKKAQFILNLLEALQRKRQSPVKTLWLALEAGIPERTMRYWLSRLEGMGLVIRVGRRKGWMLAR